MSILAGNSTHNTDTSYSSRRQLPAGALASAGLLEGYPIANISMGNLTAQDFAKWRDERLKEVAPASVNREMALMGSALNHARKEWGMIKVSPMADVAKLRNRRRVIVALPNLRSSGSHSLQDLI
ncbi:MAG: hypothetical protein ABJL72_10280 [Roseobacter sp.]